MRTRLLLLALFVWAAPIAAQSLPAFRSDPELAQYLLAIRRRVMRLQESMELSSAMAAPAAADAKSITNTQHAGVDEGGIVKLHGDYLVMLRRGRLFTVDISNGGRRPVAAVDAFGPGIEPGGTWYDELIVAGNKVVVIGYSYARGGSEVGTFEIDDAGGLRHLSTYQLRSNDYYSSRNYASRLIGTKLIFYTPLYFWADPKNALAALPAMRRWSSLLPDGGPFVRTVPAQRVYRTGGTGELTDDAAMHTVTVCELAREPMDCKSTVVIGPSGRVFYVSAHAVYVWMSSWGERKHRDQAPGKLVRMPLDGSSPTAVGVAGAPVDQFSSWKATTAISTCWCAAKRTATRCGRRRSRPATPRCCACPCGHSATARGAPSIGATVHSPPPGVMAWSTASWVSTCSMALAAAGAGLRAMPPRCTWCRGAADG